MGKVSPSKKKDFRLFDQWEEQSIAQFEVEKSSATFELGWILPQRENHATTAGSAIPLIKSRAS